MWSPKELTDPDIWLSSMFIATMTSCGFSSALKNSLLSCITFKGNRIKHDQHCCLRHIMLICFFCLFSLFVFPSAPMNYTLLRLLLFYSAQYQIKPKEIPLYFEYHLDEFTMYKVSISFCVNRESAMGGRHQLTDY